MNLLDKLEKLLAQATPGPWEQHDHGGTVCAITDTERHLCTPLFQGEGRQNDMADANLIAAMRNSLPLLIAAARIAEMVQLAAPPKGVLLVTETDWAMRIHQLRTALAALKEEA